MTEHISRLKCRIGVFAIVLALLLLFMACACTSSNCTVSIILCVCVCVCVCSTYVYVYVLAADNSYMHGSFLTFQPRQEEALARKSARLQTASENLRASVYSLLGVALFRLNPTAPEVCP